MTLAIDDSVIDNMYLTQQFGCGCIKSSTGYGTGTVDVKSKLAFYKHQMDECDQKYSFTIHVPESDSVKIARLEQEVVAKDVEIRMLKLKLELANDMMESLMEKITGK